MTTLYEVRQDSLLSLGDGNTPAVPMARMGFPANISKWDMFALAGRVSMGPFSPLSAVFPI